MKLHGFFDACQYAMAAVIYLVVSLLSAGSTTLICSKTKIAPLKKLIIHRLEVTAALLLAELIHQVKGSLHEKVEAIHLWTDFQVTFMWINSHASRWMDYVRNRVTPIEEIGSILASYSRHGKFS